MIISRYGYCKLASEQVFDGQISFFSSMLFAARCPRGIVILQDAELQKRRSVPGGHIFCGDVFANTQAARS